MQSEGKKRTEVIILTGIPASGKSTFYKETFFPQYVYISLDQLRTRNAEAALFAFCLRRRKSCVIDNTNINATERARYIGAAKASRAKLSCYFFEPNVDGSIVRNAKRTGRACVPNYVIHDRAALYSQPSLDEGFDEIYRVSLLPRGKFKVELIASALQV